MSERLENIKEVSDNFTDQANRINCLIKKFVDLKEVINKYKTNRYYWELRYSVLSINTWLKKVKYMELQKRETQLRTTIFDITRLTDIKEQELKTFTAERATYFFEQRDNFQREVATFTDDFLLAQKEYLIENLSKEIKHYSEEYKESYQGLQALKNKLINIQKNYDLNCVKSSRNNNELSKVNSILGDLMKNNNIKLLIIKSARDELKKMKSVIKQKKMVINLLDK